MNSFMNIFRSPYSQPKANVREQGQPRVNHRIVDLIGFIDCFDTVRPICNQQVMDSNPIASSGYNPYKKFLL